MLGYESPDGTVASENQLNQPKMCENQRYVSQAVHLKVAVQSCVYTFPLSIDPEELGYILGTATAVPWLCLFKLHINSRGH